MANLGLTLKQGLARSQHPSGKTPRKKTPAMSVSEMATPRILTLKKVPSPIKKIKSSLPPRLVSKLESKAIGQPDILPWNCTPSALALWIDRCFTAAAQNLTETHRQQLFNFIRLMLDQVWDMELRNM